MWTDSIIHTYLPSAPADAGHDDAPHPGVGFEDDESHDRHEYLEEYEEESHDDYMEEDEESHDRHEYLEEYEESHDDYVEEDEESHNRFHHRRNNPPRRESVSPTSSRLPTESSLYNDGYGGDGGTSEYYGSGATSRSYYEGTTEPRSPPSVSCSLTETGHYSRSPLRARSPTPIVALSSSQASPPVEPRNAIRSTNAAVVAAKSFPCATDPPPSSDPSHSPLRQQQGQLLQGDQLAHQWHATEQLRKIQQAQPALQIQQAQQALQIQQAQQALQIQQAQQAQQIQQALQIQQAQKGQGAVPPPAGGHGSRVKAHPRPRRQPGEWGPPPPKPAAPSQQPPPAMANPTGGMRSSPPLPDPRRRPSPPPASHPLGDILPSSAHAAAAAAAALGRKPPPVAHGAHGAHGDLPRAQTGADARKVSSGVQTEEDLRVFPSKALSLSAAAVAVPGSTPLDVHPGAPSTVVAGAGDRTADGFVGRVSAGRSLGPSTMMIQRPSGLHSDAHAGAAEREAGGGGGGGAGGSGTGGVVYISQMIRRFREGPPRPREKREGETAAGSTETAAAVAAAAVAREPPSDEVAVAAHPVSLKGVDVSSQLGAEGKGTHTVINLGAPGSSSRAPGSESESETETEAESATDSQGSGTDGDEDEEGGGAALAEEDEEAVRRRRYEAASHRLRTFAEIKGRLRGGPAPAPQILGGSKDLDPDPTAKVCVCVCVCVL